MNQTIFMLLLLFLFFAGCDTRETTEDKRLGEDGEIEDNKEKEKYFNGNRVIGNWIIYEVEDIMTDRKYIRAVTEATRSTGAISTPTLVIKSRGLFPEIFINWKSTLIIEYYGERTRRGRINVYLRVDNQSRRGSAWRLTPDRRAVSFEFIPEVLDGEEVSAHGDLRATGFIKILKDADRLAVQIDSDYKRYQAEFSIKGLEEVLDEYYLDFLIK